MKSGVDLIKEERERQLAKEGFTPEHDSQWAYGELRHAAVTYLLTLDVPLNMSSSQATFWWPWHYDEYKPGTDLSNLVRAGALIAAEIDRLSGKKL